MEKHPLFLFTKKHLLSQSLAFYKLNTDITNILDNMDVYILPVMNPDGYKYTWTTVRSHQASVIYQALEQLQWKQFQLESCFLFQNRMWRKNRSVKLSSWGSRMSPCIGADLNRNFDANWCSKSSPSHCHYVPPT